MEAGRPIALSIAGFDPCGGAGLLADIKTFEQHKVYGLGICSAQTLQTEDRFFSNQWKEKAQLLEELKTLLDHYDVRVVKIGIIENFEVAATIVQLIKQKNKNTNIVWDPVIRSSSGFDFWNGKTDHRLLADILKQIDLVTPNYEEVMQLLPGASNPKEAAQDLSRHCTVLLKGGHNDQEKGVDYLFKDYGVEVLTGNNEGMFAKHGSGCVLSAAIASQLASGKELLNACENGKRYVEQFLSSNKTLLGYHVI